MEGLLQRFFGSKTFIGCTDDDDDDDDVEADSLHTGDGGTEVMCGTILIKYRYSVLTV
jgi:hypothetical protein